MHKDFATVTPHEIIDRQNLEFHHAVVLRLVLDPSLVARARAKISEWSNRGLFDHYCVKAWQTTIDLPLEDLAKLLIGETQESTRLRSASPFLAIGALSQNERQSIRQRVRAKPAIP